MMDYESETEEYEGEEGSSDIEMRLQKCEEKIEKILSKLDMDGYEEERKEEPREPMGRKETAKKMAVIIGAPTK